MRQARVLVILALALLPSAWIAWRARDGPHLGYLHDDAIYWVCARSLAAGDGYRILSLPGEPYQTKYPPLYPLLLAAVWRIDPVFPRNLALAHLLAWLMVPLYVMVGGTGGVQKGLVAVNPFVALAGASLLSELPFSILLLLALAMVERARDPRRPAWLAIAAGALGAAAFLTRSAGVVLLAAAPLAFALRRQFHRAALFVAAMLPVVAGWFLWAHVHRSSTVSAYYTDYLGYYWQDVAARDLPGMAWRNLDSLLTSLGSLLVFGTNLRNIAWLLAAAALAGVVRLSRREGVNSFHLFTGLYLLLLVFWNYMPDQRFLLPVYPVLLAGFLAEVKNIGRTMPARARTVAAVVFLAIVAWQTAFAFGKVLPAFLEAHRARRERLLAIHERARAALPSNATLLAYRDPLVWLSTGRRAERLVVPPSLLYRGDRKGLERLADSAGEYARARGLSHALFTTFDLDAELAGADRAALEQRMRGSPRFKPLYTAGGAALCAVQ